MAIIKTDGGYNALPISYKRGNPIPLDTTAVWYDKTELETYAQSGVTAYVGQILTLVDTTKNIATAYVIANVAGDLEEVGATPIGDTKSIVVDAETKTISLKGVTGLDFNKKDAEGKDVVDGEGNIVKVQYQPLMTENGLVWVIPSETTVEGLATLIAGLDERVSGLETKVGKAAEGENAATGLYKVIEDAVDAIEIPVTGIADGEKVLSLTDTKLATTLSIAKTKKADGKTYVQLIGKDNAVVSEFDAAEFVADGMLESVTKDTATNEIIFKWNTSAGITETKIDIDDLVEVYTAGNGIDITDFAVSVKRDSTSEAFLSVGTNGIKLSGVQSAIDSAKQAAIDDADGKLADKANSTDVYTKNEVDGIRLGLQSNIDNLAGEGRTTETVKGNADQIAINTQAIINIKNGETLDNFKAVEGELAKLQSKAPSGETYAYISHVNNLKTTSIDPLAERVGKNEEAIGKLDTLTNNNKGAIEGLDKIINGDPDSTDSNAQSGIEGRLCDAELAITNHESAYKVLNETVTVTQAAQIKALGENKANAADVYTKTQVNNVTGTPEAGKTLADMIQDHKDVTYTKDQVNAITGTPDEGKTLAKMIKDLEGNVYTKNDVYTKDDVYTKEEIGDWRESGNLWGPEDTLVDGINTLDGVLVGILGSDAENLPTIREIAAEEAAKIAVPTYDLKKAENSGEYAAVYRLTKDGTEIGDAINIPKDMMVQSGEVKDLEAGVAGEGKPAGTYIVLTLANSANDKIYIPADSLVEYVGGGVTDTITVEVDKTTHEVTASINSNSITKEMLDRSISMEFERISTNEGVLKDLTNYGVDAHKPIREISAEEIANVENIATTDKIGTVKSVSENTTNGVAVAADGTMSVNSISTDKLVQGTKVLVISGGKSNYTPEVTE